MFCFLPLCAIILRTRRARNTGVRSCTEVESGLGCVRTACAETGLERAPRPPVAIKCAQHRKGVRLRHSRERSATAFVAAGKMSGASGKSRGVARHVRHIRGRNSLANRRKLVSTRPGNFPGALTCDLRGGNTTWKS